MSHTVTLAPLLGGSRNAWHQSLIPGPERHGTLRWRNIAYVTLHLSRFSLCCRLRISINQSSNDDNNQVAKPQPYNKILPVIKSATVKFDRCAHHQRDDLDFWPWDPTPLRETYRLAMPSSTTFVPDHPPLHLASVATDGVYSVTAPNYSPSLFSSRSPKSPPIRSEHAFRRSFDLITVAALLLRLGWSTASRARSLKKTISSTDIAHTNTHNAPQQRTNRNCTWWRGRYAHYTPGIKKTTPIYFSFSIAQTNYSLFMPPDVSWKALKANFTAEHFAAQTAERAARQKHTKRLDPRSGMNPPPDRQHLSYDVCLEVKGGYQNCSVLYCVLKLCSHNKHTQMRSSYSSLCVDSFVFISVYFVLCFFSYSIFIVGPIIVSTVGWTWLDLSRILGTYLP